MSDVGRVRIRPVRASDLPFLAEMLVEAAWPPWFEPKPTAAHAMADPRTSRYLRDWARAHDAGVVAESDGTPVGAAWYRAFPAHEPGTGFVSEAIPEVAIAVVAEQRGRGVGGALLKALVAAAAAAGEPGLSLSVNPRNEPAVRLYRSLGFRGVELPEEETSLRVLSLSFAASGPGRVDPR